MPYFFDRSENQKVLLFFHFQKLKFYIFFTQRITLAMNFEVDLLGLNGCSQFMQRAQILSSKKMGESM